MITCTVSSGGARFAANGGTLQTAGVTHMPGGSTATLTVIPEATHDFQNKGVYCTDININFFYLFISEASELLLMCPCPL